MPRRPILCIACSRLQNRTETGANPNPEGNVTCTSYPQGIPDDIWFDQQSHLESREGEPPFNLARGQGPLWRLKDWSAGHEREMDAWLQLHPEVKLPDGVDRTWQYRPGIID